MYVCTVPLENNFPMGIFWNILEYFGILWNIPDHCYSTLFWSIPEYSRRLQNILKYSKILKILKNILEHFRLLPVSDIWAGLFHLYISLIFNAKGNVARDEEKYKDSHPGTMYFRTIEVKNWSEKSHLFTREMSRRSFVWWPSYEDTGRHAFPKTAVGKLCGLSITEAW